MEPSILFFGIVIGYVVLAALAAIVASVKGHNFYSYLALGLTFSPAAVLVAALVTEPQSKTLA